MLANEAAARVRAALVATLGVALLALYGIILGLEVTRDIFELAVPNAAIVLCSLGGSSFAIAALWLTDDRFVPGIPLGRQPRRRRVA